MTASTRWTGGGTFGRGIRQFEGLLDLELGQSLDLQDFSRECIYLALLLDRQQALLDRVERDGIDQIAQRDARLHLALEAHQDGLGHVERHDAGGGGKGDELGLLAIFFIAFGVLIVMFQLVPGIILFFGMLKGLFSSAGKKLPNIM